MVVVWWCHDGSCRLKRGRRDREEERKIIINKCIVFNFVAKIRALIWSELCNGKSNRIRWCIIFVYFEEKKYVFFLYYTPTSVYLLLDVAKRAGRVQVESIEFVGQTGHVSMMLRVGSS